MQVLQGRSFDDADVTGERPVAILSERAVRQMFQVPNPIGRTFEWADAPNRPVEVVGIVEDHLPYGLRDEPMRTVYTPMSNSALRDGVVVVAKASLPATALAATAREFVRASGRKLLVGGIRTMESQINDSIGHERALAWLSAAFAMLAAILAGVGLYGVMSYQVARQTHEIGVRLAIGARPATVLADMLGRGLALTGIGIAAGLVVAWFATSAVSTLLYGLSPTDPATVAGVVVGLGSVALAATYLPARRAARIDPLQALRSE
jgi:hypothetical protein